MNSGSGVSRSASSSVVTVSLAVNWEVVSEVSCEIADCEWAEVKVAVDSCLESCVVAEGVNPSVEKKCV